MSLFKSSLSKIVIAALIVVALGAGWFWYQSSLVGGAEDKKIGDLMLGSAIAGQFNFEHKRYPKDMAEIQSEFQQSPIWSKVSADVTPDWPSLTYVETKAGKGYVLRTAISPSNKLWATLLTNLPQRRDGQQAGLDCTSAKGFVCFVSI